MSDAVELTRILSPAEENFVLAVIEYAGNLKAAWISVFGESSSPRARAHAMLLRPEISARYHELTKTVKDLSLVTLESHVSELAEIRDLAKVTGSLKVALAAERARGEAAGLYIGKMGQAALPAPTPVPNESSLENLAHRLVALQRAQRNSGVIDVEATEVPVQAQAG